MSLAVIIRATPTCGGGKSLTLGQLTQHTTDITGPQYQQILHKLSINIQNFSTAGQGTSPETIFFPLAAWILVKTLIYLAHNNLRTDKLILYTIHLLHCDQILQWTAQQISGHHYLKIRINPLFHICLKGSESNDSFFHLARPCQAKRCLQTCTKSGPSCSKHR